MLLYTRRHFMPVGGKGHVEAYAPKDMSDNEALERPIACYWLDASPKPAEAAPAPKPAS